MVRMLVELNCPEHGLERFKIKVVKRLNMPANTIMPKYGRRPKPDALSCLWVGRSVSSEEIKEYLIDYLDKKGLWENIIRIKMI